MSQQKEDSAPSLRDQTSLAWSTTYQRSAGRPEVEGEIPDGGSEEQDQQDLVHAVPRTASASQQVAPDGGWGWVVLAATILVLALTLAFPSCLGIFYTDLQTEFDATNTETSWVPSIMTAVLHAGGPLCSVLVERYGCRATVMMGGVLSGLGMAVSSFARTITELYITAGIVTGLGFCLCFQPAVTIMGHYFVRRRAFANAMSSTGTAIGLSTLPLLAHFLHSWLGWRGSFLVLGGVLLNCCVCGAVMRPVAGAGPRTERQNGHPLGRKKGGEGEALGVLAASLRRHMAFDLLCSDARYRLFALGITWMMLGFVVPLVYLVPYATSHGMADGQAALLLAILGVVNIFARPLAALLFNLPWFQSRRLFVYVFAAALLVNGLSNCICCIAASFPVLLGYVITYGVSMSVVGSLLFTVLMDIVDMRRFPAALGLLSIMESVTLLVGPPLAGLLVDSTGQYSYIFYACASSVSSSALFIMGSFYWLDRVKVREARGSQSLQTLAPKPTIALSPDCQYSSVPTGGGVAPQTESVYITSV